MSRSPAGLRSTSTSRSTCPGTPSRLSLLTPDPDMRLAASAASRRFTPSSFEVSSESFASGYRPSRRRPTTRVLDLLRGLSLARSHFPCSGSSIFVSALSAPPMRLLILSGRLFRAFIIASFPLELFGAQSILCELQLRVPSTSL